MNYGRINSTSSIEILRPTIPIQRYSTKYTYQASSRRAIMPPGF